MPESKCSQGGQVVLSDESITSDTTKGTVHLDNHTRRGVSYEPGSLMDLLARLEQLP
jgi:hypothetical protein